MRTKQIALILYVMCCLLAIFAAITDNDMLMLLSKPAIIPAILYYYLTSKTTKVNWILFSVLMLNFIGDTIVLLKPAYNTNYKNIVLLEIKNQTLIIMIPYFFSYLLLFCFVLFCFKRCSENEVFIVGCIYGITDFLLSNVRALPTHPDV